MQSSMLTQSLQLVSALPGTDLWEDITPWMPTANVLGVRGVLILAEKLNNFRVRIGIQTAANDPEAPDAPLNPLDDAGAPLPYITTPGKNFFTFDPNGASSGNI